MSPLSCIRNKTIEGYLQPYWAPHSTKQIIRKVHDKALHYLHSRWVFFSTLSSLMALYYEGYTIMHKKMKPMLELRISLCTSLLMSRTSSNICTIFHHKQNNEGLQHFISNVTSLYVDETNVHALDYGPNNLLYYKRSDTSSFWLSEKSTSIITRLIIK